MVGASVVSDRLTPTSIISVELGTVFAMLLHGSLIPQYITYYERYPKDSWGLKLVVASTGLACLGHIACIVWTLFQISLNTLTINHHTTPFAMPLIFPISLFFTAILQFLVQLTYSYRMWKFAGNWVVPIFVFLGVAYNIVGTLIFAKDFPTTSFQDQMAYQRDIFWLVNSVFINTAVNDVVITLSMCFYLRRGSGEMLKRTERLIEKLVVWTIQTSAPTCFLGFAIVATFMTDMPNNIWVGLSIFVTPIYPVALLALLNGRESLALDKHKRSGSDTLVYSTSGKGLPTMISEHNLV